MKKHLFLFSIIVLFPLCICAQETDTQKIERINNWIKKQEKQIFYFGMSLGIRTGFGSEDQSRAQATINPQTQNVDIEYGDLMSFLLSTSVTAFPIHNTSFWGNFGFTANVNLVEFSSENSSTVFNKSIDGGIGFAYAIDKDKKFAIALTYERTSIRSPKQWVIRSEGQNIVVNGVPLTSLDPKDDRYYTDRGLNAVALKFIYHFN